MFLPKSFLSKKNKQCHSSAAKVNYTLTTQKTAQWRHPLTRCSPILRPIQSLDVLWSQLKQEGNKQTQKEGIRTKNDKPGSENHYRMKPLSCLHVFKEYEENYIILIYLTYLVVFVAMGASQRRVFSISAFTRSIVSCRETWWKAAV